MHRTYHYVGPQKIADRARDALKGAPVGSANDVLAWIQSSGQVLAGSDEIIVTFVVDTNGALLIADRRSEHVACAGRQPVLSAGEMSFHVAGNEVSVCGVTNQSTGYCPEPESWPAVQAALQAAGIQSPSGFNPALIFRLCESCGSINVIQEGIFECALCSTPLPAQWNFAPKRGLGSKRGAGGTLTNARLRELAANNKPPQSWYDEDYEGLY